ncbi:hypothetical protein C475_12707 [Halosimplex carlsbadense 2-9-1]|uniref:Uncharacterized protein n=1 Tax=Halosimplex carlsbadense 2-9-1 TaxID=797114 RepID=M0CQG0_9EURY|nr:hypothetical protein [Halosimplex carlsbadense]ELZ24109.1 hypothetical protein C475_12707 [Halosimplex carlsbadense 2-9-1]
MTEWRSRFRAATTAVGAVALAVALALAGAVNVGVVPLGSVRLPWSDSAVVAGFATVAVCALALVVNHRLLLGSSSTLSAETAEASAPVSRSGIDFDERFGRPFSSAPRTDAERRRTRDRLRETAVRTVARRRSVSRERAERLVARGDWTDDAAAAAFLGDQSAPRRVRLGRRVSTRLAFRYQARRAARAVVAADGRPDS